MGTHFWETFLRNYYFFSWPKNNVIRIGLIHRNTCPFNKMKHPCKLEFY